MAHYVKCSCCGERFDRDREEFIQTSARRYAHKVCPDPSKIIEKPKTEEQLIIEYCEYLFGKEHTNYAQIKRQIKNFVKEYGYTESGIRKTLVWWFDINHGDVSKANGGIGIVPFVFNQARDYYYSLYQAEQANAGIDIKTPATKTVSIKLKIKEVKKKLFNFEEDEEIEEL